MPTTEEMEFPVWAGAITLDWSLGRAQAAPDLSPDIAVPSAITALMASGRLR